MLRRNRICRGGEDGMTMIELLIAMTVLAVGLGGIIILISGAVASNSRNKLDTTATALAQSVMERIASAGPNDTSTFTINDCASTPNTLTLDPRGAANPGYGAQVTNGQISFTSMTANTPATGYDITFVGCGPDQLKYHIRWNVTNLQTSSNGKVYSKLITVAARQKGADSATGILQTMFAQPVTLRTIVAN